MTTITAPVTGAAIKHAIETRDGGALADFYADDAVLRIVDRNNPPSRLCEVKRRSAISTFWDDICSRVMTQKVETTIADGDQLAFTQACTYPDGAKVFCISALKLGREKIIEQTVVQAWGE